MLAKWEGERGTGDVDLSEELFWVQIHGLMRDEMLPRNAMVLEERLGEW